MCEHCFAPRKRMGLTSSNQDVDAVWRLKEFAAPTQLKAFNFVVVLPYRAYMSRPRAGDLSAAALMQHKHSC